MIASKISRDPGIADVMKHQACIDSSHLAHAMNWCCFDGSHGHVDSAWNSSCAFRSTGLGISIGNMTAKLQGNSVRKLSKTVVRVTCQRSTSPIILNLTRVRQPKRLISVPTNRSKMNNFVLVNHNKKPDAQDKSRNNDVLKTADFILFDQAEDILQLQPTDSLSQAWIDLDANRYDTGPDPWSQTSSTSKAIEATSSKSKEGAEAFEKALERVEADMDYSVRRWLEQKAEEDHWTTGRR